MLKITSIIFAVSFILNSGMFNCMPEKDVNEKLFNLLYESLNCDATKRESIKAEMYKLKEELKCLL